MEKLASYREPKFSLEEKQSWVNKYVHYIDEDGKSKVGRVEGYEPDGDRYTIERMERKEYREKNFYLKGEKLRKLKIEEK